MQFKLRYIAAVKRADECALIGPVLHYLREILLRG